jgi:hypothetical protein
MSAMERKLAGAALEAAIADEEGKEDGCNCECNEKTWPNILTGLGMGAGAAMIAGAVASLMQIPAPLTFILNLYIILLGAFAFCAEARRFKILRGILYNVVKHAYFITTYTARSVFYVFMATIIFDEKSLLLMLIAIFVALVGLITFVINIVYKLPVYLDKAELKKRAEERLRREVEAKYLAEEAAKQNRFGPGAYPSPMGGGQSVPTPSQNLLNERERREQQEREKSQVQLKTLNKFDDDDVPARKREAAGPSLEDQYYAAAGKQAHDTDPNSSYSPPSPPPKGRFESDWTGSTQAHPQQQTQASSDDPFGEGRRTGKPYVPPHLQ